MGYGCARALAAGGGVIATAEVPNRLAYDHGLEPKPACTRHATTTITLKGAPRGQTVVEGSWLLLATDGVRLALARLDERGLPTGELSLVGLDGKRLVTPRVDPATVKAATDAWLTPDGLILRTDAGIRGPGWKLARVVEATVAEGRLLYVKDKAIRVRRIRDGVDRLLLKVPEYYALVAAGSFGLAVAIESANRTRIYRLPWRVIDLTLAAR
jgi:hypothetical protein